MAKPNTPSHLMEKTKKHYTKAEMKERKAREVTAKSNDIKPSSFLPKTLHKRFKWFVEEMAEWGILSNLDADSLSRYILADQKYWEVQKEMAQLDFSDPAYGRLSTLENKYFDQTLKLATQLGLTMVGRMKLDRRKGETETEELTEEETLFGNALKIVR
ncbi:P27 family phage terminase small subunit [Aerococcaceae bacterium zg-ZJ1578]|uniref:P27 family phage terminase small subunit n=1 Tax=Aerococcaceae bacterium zg-252 TaxID=2796928 RepID=UPI001A181975|nr:P27 family phage terminase small subunit [Aerococcaceae bacterium zg-1578]MBR7928443.1 P27 family phage terminase small subunit [Aerococcaceae bacterium zg-ZUI334]MBS4462856.1 P27 family phage terminase small subunit [Aerococcaceae bacterium zg-B36]